MSMNIKTLRVTTYDIRVNVDNNMSGERLPRHQEFHVPIFLSQRGHKSRKEAQGMVANLVCLHTRSPPNLMPSCSLFIDLLYIEI